MTDDMSPLITTICGLKQLTGKKKSEYPLQIPVLQGIVATVKDFPQRGSKAPFITLQSQVV